MRGVKGAGLSLHTQKFVFFFFFLDKMLGGLNCVVGYTRTSDEKEIG